MHTMTVRGEKIKPITVSVRVDEDLLDALRQLAKENDRTITGELRRAMKTYLGLNGKAVA